jgi:dihydroorotate dehydrogenase electron transfer subunit
MGLTIDKRFLSYKPGQFLMIRIRNGIDPFLRRPFSIYNVDNEVIEILYKIVGKGTDIMKDLREGDPIHILGPLGNGFIIKNDIETPILVAGGIGIASLNLLAGSISRISGIKDTYLLIGGKKEADIMPIDKYIKMGYSVEISTEDGSLGIKGMVTDLLEKRVSSKSTIFACGPNEMLKKVSEIAGKYNILCQVSLESSMACGMGVCLGCVVKVKNINRYKLVCKDGPIFNGNEILW